MLDAVLMSFKDYCSSPSSVEALYTLEVIRLQQIHDAVFDMQLEALS